MLSIDERLIARTRAVNDMKLNKKDHWGLYLRNSSNFCCNRVKVSSSTFTYANNSGNFTAKDRSNTKFQVWYEQNKVECDHKKVQQEAHGHHIVNISSVKQKTMHLPKRRNKCSAPYILDGEILSVIASRYCCRSFLYKRMDGNALSK